MGALCLVRLLEAGILWDFGTLDVRMHCLLGFITLFVSDMVRTEDWARCLTGMSLIGWCLADYFPKDWGLCQVGVGNRQADMLMEDEAKNMCWHEDDVLRTVWD